MRKVYSKEGKECICENDQYDLMIKAGYLAEPPKEEAKREPDSGSKKSAGDSGSGGAKKAS